MFARQPNDQGVTALGVVVVALVVILILILI